MKTGLVITHLSDKFVPDRLGKSGVEVLAGVFDAIELSNSLDDCFSFSENDLFFDDKGVSYSNRVNLFLENNSVSNGYVNHGGKVIFSMCGEVNRNASGFVNSFERLILAGAYVGKCHLLTFSCLKNYFPNIKEFVMIGETMINSDSGSVGGNNFLHSSVSKDFLIDSFKDYYLGSFSYLSNKPFIVDFNNLLIKLSMSISNRVIRQFKEGIDFFIKNKPFLNDVVNVYSVNNGPVLIRYYSSVDLALKKLS